MSSNLITLNSKTITNQNTLKSSINRDSLFNLINMPKIPKIEKEKIIKVSKKEKPCPWPIKKTIELKREKKNKKKPCDFDFTKIEFFDTFSNVEEFSNFYDKKILINKKIHFFNQKIDINLKKIRKLNLIKFIFREKHDIIYECDFCEEKFLKHTSLGGHISRSHWNKKKKIKKNKQNTIERSRKQYLNNL